jgi:hypothetical protein
LTVWRVVATGAPPRVSVDSSPVGPRTGSIACSPRALVARWIVKLSAPPLNESPANDESLRPSSQSSSWRAVITGTPRAMAAATIALAPGWSPTSVCMLAVKAP